MRFFNAVLLLAMTSGSLVSAGDICPGTYCTVGERCEYDPNGPHCCGANNNRNVLQCENGVWQIRNVCSSNQFCTCTGRHDLICRNVNKREASFFG
ncbi:hypothetical protein PG984_013136 [Apiospora sp. TS-2023a]